MALALLIAGDRRWVSRARHSEGVVCYRHRGGIVRRRCGARPRRMWLLRGCGANDKLMGALKKKKKKKRVVTELYVSRQAGPDVVKPRRTWCRADPSGRGADRLGGRCRGDRPLDGRTQRDDLALCATTVSAAPSMCTPTRTAGRPRGVLQVADHALGQGEDRAGRGCEEVRPPRVHWHGVAGACQPAQLEPQAARSRTRYSQTSPGSVPGSRAAGSSGVPRWRVVWSPECGPDSGHHRAEHEDWVAETGTSASTRARAPAADRPAGRGIRRGRPCRSTSTVEAGERGSIETSRCEPTTAGFSRTRTAIPADHGLREARRPAARPREP